MVVDVDPTDVLGTVFDSCESALAEEEAVGGVGGAEVFIVVEAGKDGGGFWVVRELEELAGDGVG